VINAGGISYASYRVARLMEELVNYQPDLFIIYTGQNEFLEERTYGQLRDVPAAVRTTVSLLAKTRSWTAMTAALKKAGVHPQAESGERDQLAGEVAAKLDRTDGLQRYTRDDRLRDNILEHYRISLERTVALARAAGAQVIFVTPASNLKDCTPFKSEHTAGLDAAAQQRSAQQLAMARDAMLRRDWPAALGILDQAVTTDPRHAELLYRRGQVLYALGRFDEAEVVLRQARDEDVCPLRALTPMPRIVAEVARDQRAGLVDYVELLRQRMQGRYGHPILGEEYFLDHVHPTIEGYRILALALLQTMAGQGIVKPGADWGEQTIARVTAAVEGRIDQRAHGEALSILARTLLWAGKVEDAERLAVQAMAMAGDYQKVTVEAASVLTTVYELRGDRARALQLLYQAVEQAPGAIILRYKLGLARLNPPFVQLEEAAANMLLVCQQMPEYDEAHQLFGLAMARRGNPRIAYASLIEALRLNPNNAGARATLAQIQPLFGGNLPGQQMPIPLLEVYPSLTPRRLVQVRYDAGGRSIIDGIDVEWHENGHLKRFQDFDMGVAHGLDLSLAAEGRLLSRVAYANGKRLALTGQ
jgi:tetratricopeptide (TPR) repeat protein